MITAVRSPQVSWLYPTLVILSTTHTVSRFFEWYRGSGQKQPYFIYFAESGPTEEMMEALSSEEEELETAAVAQEVKAEGDEGRVEFKGRMLTLAGLFDIWRAGPNVSVWVVHVVYVYIHPQGNTYCIPYLTRPTISYTHTSTYPHTSTFRSNV